MTLWKSWRDKRKQAYAQLVAQVSEHDVIREAEEIVGSAWMAGLLAAEAQDAAEHVPGRVGDRDAGLRAFVERERAAWVEAERMRALEVLADRDRLAEAAHTAALEEGTES